MGSASVDIDEVVRRVLDRLRATGAAAGGGAPGGPVASPTASESAHGSCGCGGGASTPCHCKHEHDSAQTGETAAAGQLRLDNPVVSLEHLSGRLQGIRSVLVGRSAVVTPAARDLLRQHRVDLARAEGATRQAAGSVVLAVAETTYEPAMLVRTLMQQGTQVQRLAQCGLFAAVDEIADAVAHGGQCGVLLTRETAAALCLANRVRGVRGALGSSLDAVRAARVSVGTNLLVIDPLGRGLFELLAIIRACATGPIACPEPLKQRLG